MNIYLIYDKDTKVYKGNENTQESAGRKIKNDDKKNSIHQLERNYKNCDFIEYDLDKWKEFLNTNPEIIKIIDGKLVSEKREIDEENIKYTEFKKMKDELIDKAILGTITEKEKNNYSLKLNELKQK